MNLFYELLCLFLRTVRYARAMVQKADKQLYCLSTQIV